jgi:RNA polymerase sigma factor (sigma-70 family)
MKSKKKLQGTHVQKDKDERFAMGKSISVHRLLLQLKHGHEQALDMLYPRYGRVFYAYARRHHLSHEDAEDVVQVVFWRVLEHIERYDEAQESGEKWLWSICRNQIIDRFRARKELEFSMEEDLVEEFDPDDRLLDQERLQALQYGWAALSEEDRNELRRGRGRGPGRKAWHLAIVKLRNLCKGVTDDATT